jgi:hypothetical protein
MIQRRALRKSCALIIGRTAVRVGIRGAPMRHQALASCISKKACTVIKNAASAVKPKWKLVANYLRRLKT